jgi:Na+-driven multidrug efflux pump
MLVALVLFLPLAAVIHLAGAGVVALWWALAGWLLARLVAVALRYWSGAWIRTGPLA